MKVIFFGLGSIGNRHANIVSKSYGHQLFALRTGEGAGCNDLGIEEVHTWDEVKHIGPDVAFITNPTFMHIDTARKCAELGIKLFIEKPIGSSNEGLDKLIGEVESQKLVTYVAYNLRFHPVIKRLKEYLKDKKLYHASVYTSSFLPEWRPAQWHMDTYSASKDKGGGVALDLSHEIDYMRFLFEDPVSWKIIKSKASDLDIDSEDLFEGLYRFPSGFLCSVHMDYICHDKKREMNIIGSEGTIRCNLVEKYIKIQKNNGELSVIEDDHLFDIAESYRTEMNHFIECIEKDEDPQITLDDGIEVLKLLEDSHV